jgi:hypothetical protein
MDTGMDAHPVTRYERKGAKDRDEHRKAAGAFAEAVIRSVELIVQPDVHDVARLLPNLSPLVNVRFSPNNGHRTAVTECPLRAKS